MNVVLPYKMVMVTYEGFFLRLVKSLEDLIVPPSKASGLLVSL